MVLLEYQVRIIRQHNLHQAKFLQALFRTGGTTVESTLFPVDDSHLHIHTVSTTYEHHVPRYQVPAHYTYRDSQAHWGYNSHMDVPMFILMSCSFHTHHVTIAREPLTCALLYLVSGIPQIRRP